ncbi:hypothetical protein C7959_12438 [Orenia marismortui]|uniref:Uncharacterized protein n=2 Tax=Orenia marismortui TaxID=46469 RepID=A0A4R8H376_9FIRM|nr:hypothetical protein C7959_12438 [Orenia marismortui]
MIDGQVVATGDAVKMGTIQNFSMKFSYPSYVGLPADTINNEVTAGASYVVKLNTGKIDSEQLNQKLTALKETEQNLENENFDDIKSEAVTGDILHTIGLSYFAQLDMFNKLLAQKNKVKSTRITSASITAIDLNVSYMFGQPRTASPGGLNIDVDRDLHVSMGSTGDKEQVKFYNMVSGMISSYLEGSIFEQTFGGEAVSTMHILKHANQQGIPVYTINQDNVDSVLPQLEYDSAKKQEFRNLINNGKEITVPERDVTINGWSGTGYIVLNPDDGTGEYIISGGLSGGAFDFLKSQFWSLFNFGIDEFIQNPLGSILAFKQVIDQLQNASEDHQKLINAGKYSEYADMMVLDSFIYFVSFAVIAIPLIALFFGGFGLIAGLVYTVITTAILWWISNFRNKLYEEYMNNVKAFLKKYFHVWNRKKLYDYYSVV